MRNIEDYLEHNYKIILPSSKDKIDYIRNTKVLNVECDKEYVKEIYEFDGNTFLLLDDDNGFINEILWKKLKSTVEFGEYDFINLDQCLILIEELNKLLSKENNQALKTFYLNFKRLAELAVIYDTGLGLDW